MTPPPHHSDNTTNTTQETPITPRGYIYTDWSTTPDDTVQVKLVAVPNKKISHSIQPMLTVTVKKPCQCVQLCRAVPECEVGEIDLPNCHIFPQPHYTFHKSYYEKSTHLVFYWTEYHRRGNRLYRLYEFETRYYDARKICQQEEGQLAVLDSQVKIQEVLDVMDSKGNRIPLKVFCSGLVHQIIERYGTPTSGLRGRALSRPNLPDRLGGRDYIARHYLIPIPPPEKQEEETRKKRKRAQRQCIVCAHSEIRDRVRQYNTSLDWSVLGSSPRQTTQMAVQIW
ncbi:hypothetical protein Pmani_010330 [Petrolisthes manimaculis]|uniref:C-type lectin domain-containing protein n=1 Tax=Petrolisthes manimaculis TaxID=1843537 RepID=A0AAE1Q5A6_9EUCA|nr:hypothetical protein Pmani_010330 [Petrolisthes manimaculis]